MKKLLLVAFALTFVACASQSPRQARSPLAATFAPGVANPPVTTDASGRAAVEIVTLPVEEVDIEAIDNGRVCEKRRRPGSNITQTFCYTREEHLAGQESRDEATRDQLDELEREARWRDEIIRQSTLEGRRPSGFGLGPN